jgi:hypothetical protein
MTRIAVLVCLAAMCDQMTALAQQDVPRGGFRTVFGGAAEKPAETQSIDLLATIAEAYDQNLTADLVGPPTAPYQISGAYTSLVPQIDAAFRGKRVQFSATGSSSERYYQSLDRVIGVSQTAAAGVTIVVDRSTTVVFNQGISYAPVQLYALFASVAPATLSDIVPTSDYQTTSEHYRAYATTMSVTHSLGDRSSFSINGDYRYTTFLGNAPGFFNQPAADGGGKWTYAVRRDLRLRLGYTYRHTQYSPSIRPNEHDFDFGVDYIRPLSATRRATMGFTLGPTMVTGPLAVGGLSENRSHYRLTGDAFVGRQMGRTWHARASYHRNLGYIAGLAAPVYDDGANVEMGGFLNRRVDVMFSAAYALGALAGQRQSGVGQFTSYTGDARMRVGLNHDTAAFVEGLFYDYAFDRNLLLPGLPGHLTRKGVRAGLTLWLPVRSR